MNLYRALKKNIRKGNSGVYRKSWRYGEMLYSGLGGPLVIVDITTPPPFQRRNLMMEDLLAKDWY